MDAADKAVITGAEFLDSKVNDLPDELTNWREKIDLSTLNIADEEKCILGQLFGDYMRGKEMLGLYDFKYDETDFVTYGYVDGYTGGVLLSSGGLTSAWKKYLSEARYYVSKGEGSAGLVRKVFARFAVDGDSYIVTAAGRMVNGEFIANLGDQPYVWSTAKFSHTFREYVSTKIDLKHGDLLLANKGSETVTFTARNLTPANPQLWLLSDVPTWADQAHWERQGYTNFRKVEFL